jgi:hypothetical protein
MEPTVPAAVTYIGLPISSGGAHALGRMTRRAAYAATMEFVATCTQLTDPIKYSFIIHSVPELKPPPGLEAGLRHRFGRFEEISPERVSDALDLLDLIDPQPTNKYGMEHLWFWATCQFLILDPATGQPLPGQDPEWFHNVEYDWRKPLGRSSLRLILNNRASLGIELCIPDASEKRLRSVVPWLQSYLPFKFSPKHWRAWTPTSTGTFKARRMAGTPGA